MINNVENQIRLLEKTPNYLDLVAFSDRMILMKAGYMSMAGIDILPLNRYCLKNTLDIVTLAYDSVNRYRDQIFVFSTHFDK